MPNLTVRNSLGGGVPAIAIDTFGYASKNTFEEAVALKAWVKENNASVVVIPVEIFGARRVRWIFNKIFTGTVIKIKVQAFDPPDYSRRNWWETRGGRTAFHSELLKYFFYRLRY
jgi:hypothetical protein